MHGITTRRKSSTAVGTSKPRPSGKRGAATAASPPETLRISPRLDRALSRLVEKTGRPKTYHIRRALERYVEDTWDYLLAVESDKASKGTISLDELRKK